MHDWLPSLFSSSPSTWINVFLVGISFILLLSTTRIFSGHSEYLFERGEMGEITAQATLFAGMVLWPVVWDMLFGYASLNTHPWLILAFIWPILVTWYQAVDTKYDRAEDLSDVHQRRKHNILGVQGDANTLVSIAFAMGGIFMIMPNLTDNKLLLKNAAYVVIVALLICLSLILPTANFVVNSHQYTYVIRSIQRVSINYALGLIMAALIMVIQSEKIVAS